ncbi:MAG: bifunctional riboflavin kinase/FAD synthetase [Pseudomonadota bacterium]
MRLIRRLAPRCLPGPGFVATIGSYDGLHLGHRALLDRVQVQAGERGLASMVVTFEPLPREYFAPQAPPARLTTFRERWRLLERTQLDVFCALHFSRSLQHLPGVDFARQLGFAGIRSVVVGHDFRAGRGGEATAEWLQAKGPGFGFDVEVLQPVLFGGVRVSSRGVREALGRGDLASARDLLGRDYSMVGRVIRGAKLGRTLGFPTANLRLSRRRTPTDGIFAVRVCGVPGDSRRGSGRPGVASLGTRPTVNGTVPLLEAHIFDFDGDLYGREIEVQFVARLRDELRFATLDEMVVQMHRDAAAARAILS